MIKSGENGENARKKKEKNTKKGEVKSNRINE